MPLRLLWIEEELSSVAWEQRFALALGYTIETVTNTADARAKLAAVRFDVVMLDLMLPLGPEQESVGLIDADAGINLLDYIRDPNRDGATPHDVPVVAFTAVVSPERKLRVLRNLTSDRFYLSKPVPEDQFTAVLEELASVVTP